MRSSKRSLAILLALVLVASCLGLTSTAMAAPGAVTGLTAKQSGATTVTLSWTAASGAEKYQINRSTSASGPWTGVKSVTGTSTSTSNGISAGTTYYFMVQAFTEDSGGARYYGAQSNVASVKINDASTVGQATNLQVTLDGTTAKLTWNAAANATKYEVQRSTTSGTNFKSQKSVSGTNTVNMNLTKGTTYYYRIMPFKEVGGTRVYGTASGEKSVTVGSGDTGAVGMATGLSLTTSGTTVNLSWRAAANATHYEVQRSLTSGSGFKSQKSVTGTSTTNLNLTEGTTYYYRIMPYKIVSGARVYGTASGEKSITVGATGPVGQATDLVISVSGTTASLIWKAAANATHYEIQRSTTPGSGFVSQKSVTGTSTTNASLVKGTTYYYRIMPYKIVNGARVYGTASGEKSITVGASGSNIGDVTGLEIVSIETSAVNLKWQGATNAVYYEVRRSTDKNGPFVSQKSVSGTSTTNVVPDTGVYYYQVCGYVTKSDNTRQYGNPSEVVTANVGTPVSIGSISTISVAKKNASMVTVSWSAAASANMYHVYGSVDGSSYTEKGSTDKTSLDVPVGIAGGTFYFKVLPAYAVNGADKKQGGFSVVKSITMEKATIAKVTGVKASASGMNVSLSWSAATNATQYQVSRATTAGGPYTGVKPVSTLSTVTEAPSYGNFYYKIRGFVLDFDGNRVYGEYSDSAKVDILIGATIKNIVAAKINTINLEWDEYVPTNVYDGYEVYRKANGETGWTLMPSTHIQYTAGSPGTYSFYDDTVVPSKTYYYSVVMYKINNGVKTTSTIGANAKSLATSVATTTITAGYGISNTEGIFISWDDKQDVDTWEVQVSSNIDSNYTTLATVDEKTFSDYEVGKVRSDGVYLKTTNLTNGVAYYVRVRGVSTLNGESVYGTWSSPKLVSAPNVTFTDVSTLKSSPSVYVKVVNSGDMFVKLPASANYYLNGKNITTKYAVTIEGGTAVQVKPGQEITSQQYNYNDSTSRTPSSSSMFDLVFEYNGYSYRIQPSRSGAANWHIN